MNMRFALVIASFAFVTACAGSLSSRIDEAKRATSTNAGAIYDESLGPYIRAAIQACLPPGSSAPENLGSFVLVGYVMASGQVADVAVEPETMVSSCFSEEFGKNGLPIPPDTDLPQGYPVLVEMRVEP
jgi:hypothetical protein